jgi:prolyl-tRNA editing enzyme YbaK/EbsC (Cys-tRNA(Pro) deacylase)
LLETRKKWKIIYFRGSGVFGMVRSSRRMSEFLRERGLDFQVVTLDNSTRTSKMAADALGCSIAQIAKSIVFVDGGAIVVVISGDKRVDARKLSQLLGDEVKIADAEAVRKHTGYVIGGVPPFPHDDGVTVLLDASLKRFDEVWAAAGTPHSVMRLTVEVLRELVSRDFVDVAK